MKIFLWLVYRMNPEWTASPALSRAFGFAAGPDAAPGSSSGGSNDVLFLFCMYQLSPSCGLGPQSTPAHPAASCLGNEPGDQGPAAAWISTGGSWQRGRTEIKPLLKSNHCMTFNARQ